MFAKVFSQIFDSSIAEDYKLRHFFMDLLVLADLEGHVDMTPRSIAARTAMPIEEVIQHLRALEQPDPRSRSIEHDGARIVLLDQHRDWGWQIVNYQKYRDVKSNLDRRRISSTTDGGVHYGGYVYFLSQVGGEDSVKIGYSANPWARAADLATASPNGVLFIGCIRGGPDTETEWHHRFADCRLNGEWFRKSPELEEAINAVVDPSLRKVITRSYRSSQKQKQKQKQVQDTPPPPPSGGQVELAAKSASGFPLPIDLSTPETESAWESWQQHRREKRSKLTPTSAASQIKLLRDWGSLRWIAAINHSIQKGWQGLFEPKGQSEGAPVGGQSAPPGIQLKALLESLETHPGNPESVYFSHRTTTAAQKAEFRTLQAQAGQLRQQVVKAGGKA